MPVIFIVCACCEQQMTIHLHPYADLWASNVSKVLINRGKPEGYEYSDESVKEHPAYYCAQCWENAE